MLKWTPALNYIELKAERSRPSLPLRTLGVHSTSISFHALLPHLQFLFHLSAAKCVYSNTWQAHWRCTGSLPTLQRVTGGQHTTPAGLLMFNSDCNPFSQPVIQLFKPRSQSAAPRAAGGSCGSEQGPSLSITFNICLGVKFNLFYSATQLDRTDVSREGNKMAILMSVYTMTWETSYSAGDA